MISKEERLWHQQWGEFRRLIEQRHRAEERVARLDREILAATIKLSETREAYRAFVRAG